MQRKRLMGLKYKKENVVKPRRNTSAKEREKIDFQHRWVQFKLFQGQMSTTKFKDFPSFTYYLTMPPVLSILSAINTQDDVEAH